MPPLSLFPYQEYGAGWIAGRERCGLLDVPGIGKSAQIIRAIDLRRAKRGIIVCPAHLRANWIGEARKFGHFQRRIVKGQTIHDLVAWTRGVFDIMVVSYELATKWAPRLHEHAELLDFIAYDEFHYLSNFGAKRTTTLLGENGDGVGGLTQWACQVFAVTGTLTPNDPSQSYAFLRLCGAMPLSRAAFLRRYFHTRALTWGSRSTPRPDMVGELREIIGRHSIRRTFADVGVELPPIFLTDTLVDGDTDAIRVLLGQHPGLDAAIVEAVRQGGLSFLDSQHIATLRRLIAEAKAVPYAEMLLEELKGDDERKVVVMGISREALQIVARRLADAGVWAVLVQGGVSEPQRVAAVEAFQRDPRCRVFVGNIRAAGTGLTLTAAAHIDILESDWTPAGNDQAIKRIRRIGQERRQHARFITLAGSLDETVNRIVAEKTAAIAMVEGDAMIAGPEIAA